VPLNTATKMISSRYTDSSNQQQNCTSREAALEGEVQWRMHRQARARSLLEVAYGRLSATASQSEPTRALAGSCTFVSMDWWDYGSGGNQDLPIEQAGVNDCMSSLLCHVPLPGDAIPPSVAW